MTVWISVFRRKKRFENPIIGCRDIKQKPSLICLGHPVKLINMPWNLFCIIWFIWQLPDCFSRILNSSLLSCLDVSRKRKIERYFEGVLWVFQGSFMGVSWKFLERGSFKDVFLRVFPECFKEVSRKLLRCFKKVSCCMALNAASRAEGWLVFYSRPF